MRKYQKLERFPLGAVKAEGYMKDQLIRSKNGMGGHLYELEPGMINDPYLHRTEVPQWSGGNQLGWGAEISGNYWTGFIQLAFVLGDEEMIAKATEWVDEMLKKRRADGYLGTYFEEGADIYEDYNAWGTSCVMRGLLAFYEATGRQDVFDAVYGCMLWFAENWKERKTAYAGRMIVEPVIDCYHYTGDERLLRFAEDYEEFLVTKDHVFPMSYQQMNSDVLEYNATHTAGYGNYVRTPVKVYSANGRKELLDASVNAIKKLHKKAVQVSGGPVSVSEYIGPVSGTHETEYCSFTFFNATYAVLERVTGEAIYGDYMEEMFYNGAQGARKKDEKAIAYLSAPNQVRATERSSPAMFDMQVYAPCYPVSCCPVTSVMLPPEFIRDLMHYSGDDIYLTAYGPCTLTWGDVSVKEETLYPFRNDVLLTVDADKEFGLYFRKPRWAKGMTVTVNGAAAEFTEGEGGFYCIRRKWEMGDKVQLHFDAAVEVIHVDDSDASKKYPLAFRYGALVFSLHIPEIWTPIKGSPATPLPEDWTWYAALPEMKPLFPDYDNYDNMGLVKYRISWNVALDENIRPEDIEVEYTEPTGYLWENPCVKLKLKGYRALYLCSSYPERAFEPFGDKQKVSDELELTLEPYGCTNLRITYFPRADV